MEVRGQVIKAHFAQENPVSWGLHSSEDLPQHRNWQLLVSFILSLCYSTKKSPPSFCLVSVGNSLGFSCNKALSRNLGFVVLASKTGGSRTGGNKTVNPQILVTRLVTVLGCGLACFCIALWGHSPQDCIKTSRS